MVLQHQDIHVPTTLWKCYDGKSIYKPLINDRSYSPIPGYSCPMRLHRGQIECMSNNHRDCLWEGQCEDKLSSYNTAAIRPLRCGKMHLREWGNTGYDIPDHWCQKIRGHFNDDHIAYENYDLSSKGGVFNVEQYDNGMYGYNNDVTI